MSDTWRYALVGGVASIPLSLWLYWESGVGDTFSLIIVFVGGVLAGYLASRAPTELHGRTVGFRAGVIGSLPVLWLVGEVVIAASAWASPLWFRVAAVVLLVGGLTLVLFAFGGLIGAIGATFGGWLANKTGAGQASPVEN